MGSAKYSGAIKAVIVVLLIASGSYYYERHSYSTGEECALKMVSRLGLSGKHAIQVARKHCATVEKSTAGYDFSSAVNPFKSNKP